MKLNKWTVGLAAVGVVSLASVVKADETSSTLTSVSSTVLSGYVDTSAQWNLGDGDSHAPAYKYGGANKADGFNLDVIKLSLEKPLTESDWAAGYKVDLLFGPDANVLGTTSSAAASSDFAIKQAYVALRAPVGTGLDFKVGVFDSIIGYESTEAINNPNFSRSWGHTFEPSTHTGVLASYHINNYIAVSAGLADTLSPTIGGGSNPNGRATTLNSTGLFAQNESYKTYMGSVALTAPDDWGFIAGSTLYGGVVNGWDAPIGEPQTSVYVGATIATPVTGLRVGGAFDFAHASNKAGGVGTTFGIGDTTAHSFAAYTSYQVSEKFSVHGRAEYADLSGGAASAIQGFLGTGVASSVLALTATAQYDLWKNVLSRVELRWDHALDGTDSFGGTQAGRFQSGHFVTGTANNSWILAANIIYKF